MATFRKRIGPQGRTVWQAQILRKGHTPQYATFPTKAQAQRWAREVETEMANRVFVSEGEARSTTLLQALDRYLLEVTPRKKSAAGERGTIRRWQARPLAARALADVSGRDIADFIREREGAGMSGNTIRLELALLSHLFTVARRDWGMESLRNPVELARRPPLSSGRDRRLQPGEEAALLAAAEEHGGALGILISLAIETGLRRSEIAAMRVADVDPVRAVLTVPRHKTQARTGRPRLVPLSRAALALLARLTPHADERLCPLRPDSITQAFSAVCVAAGIKGLTFHDLRHEATSRFFERGLSLMEVAAVTGHRSLQMLQRYTHLRPETVAKRLDETRPPSP
ncbi:MAG: tyrosine-type recombinase/integrase [Acidobacteriaceae bacterium]